VLRLFQSDLEMLVRSGFIYLPLLYDLDIAREVETHPELQGLPKTPESAISKTVVELEGRKFAKSLSIQSLLTNFEKFEKDYFEQLKGKILGKWQDYPSMSPIAPNGKLQTIILKVMPHFIRQRVGFTRRHLSDEGLLDLICNRIEVPERSFEQADKVLDPEPLLGRLAELGRADQSIEPLPERVVSAEALRHWFERALQARIIEEEMTRLEQEIHEREEFSDSKRNHLAMLFYLAEVGSFELDGFGFSRIGSKDDYLIYKHTGEFILKDYYGRDYLFPDCRVAVSTAGPLRPLVIETYKHPFLLNHAPGQEICLSDYDWPDDFTGDNVIRLLEDGINAFLYGYDARRRNGYHSLDPTLYYVKTIEFADYRV
jgi:hypothetical protein